MQSNPSSLLNHARQPRKTFPVDPVVGWQPNPSTLPPLPVLGHGIPVPVRVAVQEQVVRRAHAVDPDRLPVVHAEAFVDVVAPLVLEAFRLRVPLDRHLYADDL